MAEDERIYAGVERRHCPMHGEEHLRSCINAENISQIEKNCKETVTQIYKDIKNKIPMWVFAPLLAVMLSMLALQWRMFENLQVVTRSLAVLEYRVLDNKGTINGQ